MPESPSNPMPSPNRPPAPGPSPSPSPSQELTDAEFRKYLAAFADGELDVEQNLRVLQYMAMHPQATRRVMHQQQLRQAVKRSIVSQTPLAPRHVREALEELAVSEPLGSMGPSASMDMRTGGGGALTGWFRRWAPAAAAVLILAVSLVALQLSSRGAGGFDSPGEAVLVGLKNSERFANRHDHCSKDPTMLHRGAMPTTLDALPAGVSSYLGQAKLPNLDVQAATGFRFKAAGECTLPGKGSVHLVYERAGQGAGATGVSGDGRAGERVSIWMTRYRADRTVDAGKLYVAHADAKHPMLVWREGDLLCYLVGDSEESTRAVAAAVRGSQGSQATRP